jgi:hypothetical protein
MGNSPSTFQSSDEEDNAKQIELTTKESITGSKISPLIGKGRHMSKKSTSIINHMESFAFSNITDRSISPSVPSFSPDKQ